MSAVTPGCPRNGVEEVSCSRCEFVTARLLAVPPPLL